jgi:hypothetical protein
LNFSKFLDLDLLTDEEEDDDDYDDDYDCAEE